MDATIKVNMEGTRNERVAILLTSYVIGFVTAYIAFGVVQLENSMEFAQMPPQNMASVITARQPVEKAETFIAVDTEGLIIIKNNKRTLLSATGDTSTSDFFTDGQHVTITDYSLSPDKAHVYFCELPAQDSDSCRPYIYSVADDIVYPFLINGERVAFEAKDQEVSWSENNELIVH